VHDERDPHAARARPPLRRLPRQLLAAAALFTALMGDPAAAHKASDAYLSLRVEGERVVQRLDIALKDLDREIGLDADGDALLRWGEVRQRWPDIERLAAGAVRLSSGGRPCVPESGAPPQLDSHTDGRYAVVSLTLRCAGPVAALDVDYRLFADSDPTHRGIVRLEHAPGGGTATAVLVPGAAPQRLGGGRSAADAGRSFAGFVAEGVHHIAIGLDHVLFLVVLLTVAVWRRAPDGGGWVPRAQAAGAWRETARLVTAFTLAHSLTLALAALGLLAPPSRWVESLIAISVLVTALDNIRPFLPGPRWAAVAAFGLVHGFGFAGPLQDLGLVQGRLVLPLLGFNLGVELGQLVLVALLLPPALALRQAAAYRRVVVQGGSALVALLALGWTLERAFVVELLP
jgi:hypothetical protein